MSKLVLLLVIMSGAADKFLVFLNVQYPGGRKFVEAFRTKTGAGFECHEGILTQTGGQTLGVYQAWSLAADRKDAARSDFNKAFYELVADSGDFELDPAPKGVRATADFSPRDRQIACQQLLELAYGTLYFRPKSAVLPFISLNNIVYDFSQAFAVRRLSDAEEVNVLVYLKKKKLKVRVSTLRDGTFPDPIPDFELKVSNSNSKPPIFLKVAGSGFNRYVLTDSQALNGSDQHLCVSAGEFCGLLHPPGLPYQKIGMYRFKKSISVTVFINGYPSETVELKVKNGFATMDGPIIVSAECRLDQPAGQGGGFNMQRLFFTCGRHTKNLR